MWTFDLMSARNVPDAWVYEFRDEWAQTDGVVAYEVFN